MKAVLIAIWTVLWSSALWIPERVLWLIGLPLVAVALPFSKKSDVLVTREGLALWKLPFWANWCWGNNDDSFGDSNFAINDCGRASVNDLTFMDKWVWLAWRNPCHNLCKIWIYNCNLNRASKVDWAGKDNVGNVYNSDGSVQSGFQVCWASGPWLYFRSGVYFVIRWGKSGRCLRVRIGNKIQPRHAIKEVVEREPNITWTFTISPFKKIVTVV